MKVALVAEWLDAWRGGAETSTLQFLHHLMDRGVEVHVFTRSRPSPGPGLFVHTVRGAAMTRLRKSTTFAHRVDRMLRSEDFDVIHAISPCRSADIYQPRGGTVAESVERNLALRSSTAVRTLKRYANHLNLKQRYLLRMERNLFKPGGISMIVAISGYVRRQLQTHYGVPPRRIREIYNGVDADPVSVEQRAHDRAAIRREFHVGERDLLVLSVAHNFPLKGVGTWMRALAMLHERGLMSIRSLVIGRGDTMRWHRLGDRLRVADRLTFVGPSDRVTEFYHAADVLVHPTFYDPCSRVILEGMVSGLPCITTRWDGAAEMIDDGRNGFVLSDPADADALAERVESLLDADRRKAMGAAAAKIAARVSMSKHAEQMISLYEDIVAEKRAVVA